MTIGHVFQRNEAKHGMWLPWLLDRQLTKFLSRRRLVL
jgi:hypothetical protein